MVYSIIPYYMDLLIDTYGTKIGATGERIILSFPQVKDKKEYPIHRLEKIVILRPASLTTHAVRLAIEHDVDIVYLGSFGKPIGRLFSSEPKGLASLRKAQLEASTSITQSFAIARELVRAKCSNQLDFLRFLSYHYKKDLKKEILQALHTHVGKRILCNTNMHQYLLSRLMSLF